VVQTCVGGGQQASAPAAIGALKELTAGPLLQQVS
jgi:hypothetical protein